ncbi:MAG: hypothetical protein J6A96_00815 [Clostridia bacterium]|nr:hypothetical protein [Clostridia bacterium]
MNNYDENVTELWKRYQQGIEYQETIGIRTDIPRYIDFFEGRQWPTATEATKNLPRPVLNFIKMICRNKKAAILNSKVRLVYKSDDINANVDKFNHFANFIEKEMGQAELDKQAIDDAVKKGSYFYHYYWDKYAEGKDANESGALRCELVDPLSIFFENPCELNEQKQGWIIMVTRESVDSVKARADEECNLDEIQPDELENDAYNTKEQNSNKLCTLITCYFREDGKVKCSCATKTTVVRKPFFVVPIKDGEEKPKGTELYPIVAGYYEKRDRCIYGLSEVEGLIPNQKSVNFHFAMSLLNAQENAWGKWLVMPNALKGQKITNVPGQVLVDHSGTGNGIKKLTEKTMQTFPLDVVNNLVSMTRSVSGASEVMTGETIGANMSGAAIAQLQAQAEKPIDDLRDTFWLVKKKQGKVLAQFYKHFYLDADFAYENKADGKDEKQMIQDKFTSSDYQGVNFDIVVEATQGTRSSAAADIAILETLLARGLISLETFIKSYPDEAIGNKSSILEAIKASQTNELAMVKQMLEQSQAREKELESVIKSQAEMVDNVYSIIKELQNTKKLLVDVATEEIELAKEAEAKINEANKKITDQNDYIKGLLGVPRNAMPQKQVDIANG